MHIVVPVVSMDLIRVCLGHGVRLYMTTGLEDGPEAS